MRAWLEMPLNRQRAAWGAGMGLGAMALVPLAVVWLNSLSVMPGDPLLVRASVLEATGWPWQVLLAVELALGFGFGVTVGLAVPPMEGSGHAVAVRTALHLLVSSALFAGLCWVCGLLWGSWQTWLTLLGMYWFAYAVVWLLRYLHWRSELRRIRERLGLAQPETPGEIFRCIQECMAFKCRQALEELQEETGREFSRIHILDGGAKDTNFCRYLANVCNMLL